MSVHAEVPLIQKIMSDKIGYFSVPVFLVIMMLSKLEMFSLKSMKKPWYNNPFHGLAVLSFLIVLAVNPPLSPLAAVFSYIMLASLSIKSLKKSLSK